MENRKSKYSRMVIEEAFLSLLSHTPLDKITVSEICKLADVNRSTFYAHYFDIYDLMNQITNTFFEQIFHQIISSVGAPTFNHTTNNSYQLLLNALETILQHRELCRLFVCSSPRTDFVNHLSQSVIDWCCERYTTYSQSDNPNYRLEYTMMVGGLMALWRNWAENDFQIPPQQLADIMHQYIRINIDMIWQR